jgi:hypothetical protein
VSDGSYYRREEDRKWREKVERDQVSLVTGFQVLNKRLDEMEDLLRDVDLVIRGDPREDRDGLVTQLHEIQTRLSRLDAVIFVDSTGRKGLQHEVEEILSGERRTESRWKYTTTVVVAVISVIGSLILSWDKIAAFFREKRIDTHHQAPKAKSQRKKVSHVRYRVVPAPEVHDDGADEEMPE